jgi:hypothetical protein
MHIYTHTSTHTYLHEASHAAGLELHMRHVVLQTVRVCVFTCACEVCVERDVGEYTCDVMCVQVCMCVKV